MDCVGLLRKDYLGQNSLFPKDRQFKMGWGDMRCIYREKTERVNGFDRTYIWRVSTIKTVIVGHIVILVQGDRSGNC